MNRITKIEIGSYCPDNSSSTKYRTLYVDLGLIKLYFSYQTVVAFRVDGETFLSTNEWGVNTGKHLNYINPDKKIRMKRGDFEFKLKSEMSRLFGGDVSIDLATYI